MSNSSERDLAKTSVRKVVGNDEEQLLDLSHQIHSNPELAFEEHQSSAWCARSLEEVGYSVTMGICDLPTAFAATTGSGPLNVAICLEYDALPDIGHACGHNIIASAGVGAARALADLADDLGITVRVLGTPAEEGGGGKILMLERGGFDGLNAAMMVHPWPSELIQMPCLAVSQFDVHYAGVEAHASAFPELGKNAADAITIAQVAIGVLRQHANPGDQVHGIVTYGGAAPNIVPARTSAKYFVRSPTIAALLEWEPRIKRCFEAGALATDTSVRFEANCPPYSEFRIDAPMAELYKKNAESLGRIFPPPLDRVVAASTDMANVSLAIPSIHPTLGIDSTPAVNHQAAFAAHCATSVADKAVLEGAMAMAMTVVDLASDDAERERLVSYSYTHG